MAPNPQCAALAAAKDKAGLSYAQIAQRVGSTEQRIISICTGAAVPTETEFNAITQALGIKDKAPKHTTA